MSERVRIVEFLEHKHPCSSDYIVLSGLKFLIRNTSVGSDVIDGITRLLTIKKNIVDGSSTD